MKPLLLFVDDCKDDAIIACHELERAGIDVDYAVVWTRDDLIRAIAERDPDAILCDIVMPQFDAWDALRICRELVPKVPFILHSGTVSVQDARLGMQRGVFGTAEKDLPAQLIAVVRRALKLP